MASRADPSLSNAHILVIMLLIMGVLFVSQSQNMQTAHVWMVTIARYVVYLLAARGLQEACILIFRTLSTKKISLSDLIDEYKHSCLVFVASAAVLVTSQHVVLGEEFPLFFTAYLLCQYLQMEPKQAPTINYGTGMACSYFEGYLSLVIPSDGGEVKNFVDKLCDKEDGQGVVFPVKKLLLVVPKSLFCPPDLKHYNKPDRHDLPQIEACTALTELKKDVAGVKGRRYINTPYRIYWADNSRPPVYLTVEFASPLHTLFKVLQKRPLYEELCDVDVPQLVEDFCNQLEKTIARSPDCRGKCELIYFDDSEDSEEYLPQVLLDAVARLEPQYEEIIARRLADFSPSVLLEAPPKVLTPRVSL